jgi:hypothetical protein
MNPPGVRRWIDANGVETIVMDIYEPDRPPPSSPWPAQGVQITDDDESSAPAQQDMRTG